MNSLQKMWYLDILTNSARGLRQSSTSLFKEQGQTLPSASAEHHQSEQLSCYPLPICNKLIGKNIPLIRKCFSDSFQISSVHF